MDLNNYLVATSCGSTKSKLYFGSVEKFITSCLLPAKSGCFGWMFEERPLKSNMQNKFKVSVYDKDLSKYNIITLCGSTKFKSSFDNMNLFLTLNNKMVLQPGCYAHADKIDITEEQKINLDKLHKEKIDISDCIIVINEQNYIGSSTASEIEHAITKNKDIIYMFEEITI
jgi:hypothetical protein